MKFWLAAISVTLCVSNCHAVLNYGSASDSTTDTSGYQYKGPLKQNFQPTATQLDETQQGYRYQAPTAGHQQPQAASVGTVVYQHSSLGPAVALDLEPGLAAGASAQAENYFVAQSQNKPTFGDNNGHDYQSYQYFMPRPAVATQQQQEQQLDVTNTALSHPNSATERQKYFLQKLDQLNLQSGTQTAPSNAAALAAFLSKYVNAKKAYSEPNQQFVQTNQGYNYNKAQASYTAQSDSQSTNTGSQGAQTQYYLQKKNYVDGTSAQYDSQLAQSASLFSGQSAQLGSQSTQPGSQSTQPGSQSTQYESQATQPANHLAENCSPLSHFGSQKAFTSNHLESTQYYPHGTSFGVASAQHGTLTALSSDHRQTAQFGSTLNKQQNPAQSDYVGASAVAQETASAQFGGASKQFGSQSSQFESPSMNFGSQSAQFESPSTHFGSQSAHFGNQAAHSEAQAAHFQAQAAHSLVQAAHSVAQAAKFGSQPQFLAQNNDYKYGNHATPSNNGPAKNAASFIYKQPPKSPATQSNNAPTTTTLPQYAANHKGLGYYDYTPSKPQAVTAASNTALDSEEQYQAQHPLHTQHFTASSLTPSSLASGYDYLQMQSHSFELPSNSAQQADAQSLLQSNHVAVHRPHVTYGVPAQQPHIGFATTAADNVVAPAATYLPPSNKFQAPYF